MTRLQLRADQAGRVSIWTSFLRLTSALSVPTWAYCCSSQISSASIRWQLAENELSPVFFESGCS